MEIGDKVICINSNIIPVGDEFINISTELIDGEEYTINHIIRLSSGEFEYRLLEYTDVYFNSRRFATKDELRRYKILHLKKRIYMKIEEGIIKDDERWHS
jgi:hypothetical protein